MRVLTPTGWQPIDTDLIEADGAVAPEMTAASVEFSDGTGSAVAGIDNGRKTFTLGWPGDVGEPVLEGSTASYALEDGSTLQLTAQAAGYEMTVVLPSMPTTPPVWRIPLGGANLTGVMSESGGVDVQNVNGTTVFTVASARMWDAQLDLAGDPANEGPVELSIEGAPGDQVLVVTPSSEFLTAPTTVYPVTVDPTTSVAQQNDTYVSSAAAGTNYGSDYRLRVGSTDGTVRQRSYVNFSVGMNGRHILSATLTLRQYYAATCTSKTTNVYPINDVFSGATWNTKPTSNTSTLYAASFSGNKGSANCGGGNVAVDVRKIVQGWADDALEEHGVELRANDEYDANGEKRFCAFNEAPTGTGHCEGATTTPELSVTYNRYPNKPTSLSTNPPTACVTGAARPYVNTDNPTLKAIISDPDGGKLNGSVLISAVGAGAVAPETLSSLVTSPGTAQWTVRDGYLNNGGNYSWKVRGYNTGTESGVTYSDYGSYSAACEFSVDTTAPTSPSVASVQYPAGQWASAAGPNADGTFTVSATDAVGVVDHFLYALDKPTPSVATPTGASSFTIKNMPDGWHTLKVSAVDKAGNSSTYASYSFGVGPAITSPLNGAVTPGQSIPLEARTGNGPSAVTYLYRATPADGWAALPAGDVSFSSGGGISTWPVTVSAGSGDAIAPSLSWNLAATLGGDGSAELAVCFGTSCGVPSDGSLPADASTPISVTRDSAQFNFTATAMVAPGTVNLLTGNSQYWTTDASVTSNSDDTLTVSRTLNAASVASVDGVFGPGWSSAVSVESAVADFSGFTDTGSILTLQRGDQTTMKFGKVTAQLFAPIGPAATSDYTIKPDSSTAGCAPASPTWRRCYDLGRVSRVMTASR